MKWTVALYQYKPPICPLVAQTYAIANYSLSGNNSDLIKATGKNWVKQGLFYVVS